MEKDAVGALPRDEASAKVRTEILTRVREALESVWQDGIDGNHRAGNSLTAAKRAVQSAGAVDIGPLAAVVQTLGSPLTRQGVKALSAPYEAETRALTEYWDLANRAACTEDARTISGWLEAFADAKKQGVLADRLEEGGDEAELVSRLLVERAMAVPLADAIPAVAYIAAERALNCYGWNVKRFRGSSVRELLAQAPELAAVSIGEFLDNPPRFAEGNDALRPAIFAAADDLTMLTNPLHEMVERNRKHANDDCSDIFSDMPESVLRSCMSAHGPWAVLKALPADMEGLPNGLVLLLHDIVAAEADLRRFAAGTLPMAHHDLDIDPGD